MGYHWPKMMSEAITYAKQSHACHLRHTIHLLMVLPKHSIRLLVICSRSLCPAANVIGTKNSVNVYGHSALPCEPRQKATPFSLVYGAEDVLPLKIQIPSIRVT